MGTCFLHNLRLSEGSKRAFSLPSLSGHGSTRIDMADILTTIPTTIKDILKGEKLLTSYMLLPLLMLPFHMRHILLTLNKDHAATCKLIFQAKVNKTYIDRGMA